MQNRYQRYQRKTKRRCKTGTKGETDRYQREQKQEQIELDNETSAKNKLTVWQQKVFKLIYANNKATRKEIADILNLSDSVVKKHIDALKKKGFIKREGGKTFGSWQILRGFE